MKELEDRKKVINLKLGIEKEMKIVFIGIEVRGHP
jgi:hypothetical protein